MLRSGYRTRVLAWSICAEASNQDGQRGKRRGDDLIAYVSKIPSLSYRW